MIDYYYYYKKTKGTRIVITGPSVSLFQCHRDCVLYTQNSLPIATPNALINC